MGVVRTLSIIDGLNLNALNKKKNIILYSWKKNESNGKYKIKKLKVRRLIMLKTSHKRFTVQCLISSSIVIRPDDNIPSSL